MKSSSRAYYFVRVNGNTAHNNPMDKRAYIPGEPPLYPKTFINYWRYCLGHGIIRIGWPGAGDLRQFINGTLRKAYPSMTLEKEKRVRQYLESFRGIPIGSIVLMPDRKRPGILFIGEVTGGYEYFHQVPQHPYECSHRLNVRWDTKSGEPIEYSAEECGLSIHGDFWTKAFAQIDTRRAGQQHAKTIEAARYKRRRE